MVEKHKLLVEKAKIILNNNWLGKSTKPAPDLYPHQWNWDSGFIAIGYSGYNQERAQQELSTLFKAQWKNGMLPQIVFNSEALGGYFPEPDFWQCERSPHYPDGVLTSGITMPPVHGIAALHIYQYATNKDLALEWLDDMYPRIYSLHEYFYRERDPNNEGLVYIRHPWESGLDNSPTWDIPLKAIVIDKNKLPEYERKDLKKGVPQSQRPSDDDYDRYVFLVDLFRRLRYEENAIYQECPFLIQDPLFNSILSKANEDLAKIGHILGKDTTQLEEWHEQTNRSLRKKMWHEHHGAFDAFDLLTGKRIETLTASGFLPLLCGAPTKENAQSIYHFLESNSFCPMHNHSCFSIPNYDLQGEYLDPKNYWRGPVWINTNWLLMKGLERYGFKEKAESVREDIIELVKRWGFHEYFDPYRGTGYGTDNFSWTAALFIDSLIE
ncbi:MAG: trehalase family glycosidase [Xenococcus sp. MO_188.B8]|nr:trehalase family glycosidase [Xenococcus sp. MO_188.B8]